MFRGLSAYWQDSDDDAIRVFNLAASLSTLGIKLKNTASNFIPGFLRRLLICDIYSLERCPFTVPRGTQVQCVAKQEKRK